MKKALKVGLLGVATVYSTGYYVKQATNEELELEVDYDDSIGKQILVDMINIMLKGICTTAAITAARFGISGISNIISK